MIELGRGNGEGGDIRPWARQRPGLHGHELRRVRSGAIGAIAEFGSCGQQPLLSGGVTASCECKAAFEGRRPLYSR